MTPIRRWRIHLGVHKTATTHLQDTLTAQRTVLRAAGVDYVPLGALREAWLYPRMLEAARLGGWPSRLRAHASRQRIEALLEPMRQGPDTLILSEENLLGSVAGALGEPLYPKGERIARLLRCLADKEAEVTIFLCLRSPDTLIPSAYVQLLRHEAPPPGGFGAVRARIRRRPPSWSEFLFRLRRAAGERVRFRIWRYEDYRARRTEILNALCDGVGLGLPDQPVPSRTKSVCAEAVAEAEALSPLLPRQERRRAVAAIFDAAPADAPPFSPLDPDERAFLAGSYARDLQEIGASFGDGCLGFGPGTADRIAPAGRMPFWLPVARRVGLNP